MPRIPDEFVETLQQHIDIVEVVGEYVQLRRSGRSYVGLCPFHNERTPSFSVSADRKMFYCFGCGAGGTVIRFLMDMEGLPFVETVVRLAERAHLTLPVTLDELSAPSSEMDKISLMKDAHELAAKFYSYILMNSSVGVQALSYLEKRGIQRGAMVEFRLGYAPNTERRLVDFLNKRGFKSELLVDCGLAVELGQRVVDRFRHRLIIPICDNRGSVVAFGGRALTADAKPKYLNSPESVLFHKSRVLFNLHRARREIRKTQTAVVFEGYMDVIAAWQAGALAAVASMGTSLTEEHTEILKRYADRLTIAYDGDKAGQRATKRVLDLARQARMESRVVQFPDGLDPDDFIQQRGAQAFLRQFEAKTLTEVQFLTQTIRGDANLESPAGRTAFIRTVLQLLAERASPIERDAEMQRLAAEFQISTEALTQEYRMIARGLARRSEREVSSERGNVAAPVMTREVRAGNHILRSLLLDGKSAEWLANENVTELPLAEQTVLLARLYAFRLERPDASVASFVDSVDEPELRRLASVLAMDDDGPVFDEDMLLDCIRAIRLHQLELRYRLALQALLEAQVQGQTEMVHVYRSDVDEIQQQIAQCKMQRSRGDAGTGAKEAGKE